MKLQEIQLKLKAPKNQRNNFGNYNYRSCEDILEAVKPLLSEAGAIITINDEMLNIGDRYYVKATVTFICGEEKHSVSAFAREAENKKGMDESQITGAASSYARKYALNGLLLIDDTKDADSTNKHDDKKTTPKKEEPTKPWYNDFYKDKDKFKKMLEDGQTGAKILMAMKQKFAINKAVAELISKLTLDNLEESFTKK